MAEEVNSLSGASNVVLEVEPSQFSSPNFQKREEIMQRQNSIFREQLGKFHQLLEIQKRLTGRDPLNVINFFFSFFFFHFFFKFFSLT